MAQRGRRRFKNKEEVEKLIEEYFDRCEGRPLLNADGEPVFNKFGEPVMVGQHPPTVTGLALALGFTNRQSLLNYQARPEFSDVITIAKSRVEQYTEERLFDRDGANGARFSLMMNFKGWRDESQDGPNGTAPVVKIVCDIPKVSVEPAGQTETAAKAESTEEVNADVSKES